MSRPDAHPHVPLILLNIINQTARIAPKKVADEVGKALQGESAAFVAESGVHAAKYQTTDNSMLLICLTTLWNLADTLQKKKRYLEAAEICTFQLYFLLI